MVNSGEFDGLDSDDRHSSGSCAWLEQKGLGKRAVKYRLRDWLISRQRYWGTPIPIVYCDDRRHRAGADGPAAGGAAQGVQAAGREPGVLSRRRVPKCGGAARRETDTMDTFIDSSWYFLRYASPHDTTRAVRPRAGESLDGRSTSTRAASSTRSCTCCTRASSSRCCTTRACSTRREPFTRLFNQGMVKRFGQVMSKSAGNGVSPDELVAKQGADAGRIYEMFIGPPEEDVEWTDAGLNGVVRFLQRVWRLVLEPESIVVEGSGADGRRCCGARSAQTIEKVTEHYDELRFNTAVAALMELANAMQDSPAERRRARRGLGRGGPHAGEAAQPAGAARLRGDVGAAGGARACWPTPPGRSSTPPRRRSRR